MSLLPRNFASGLIVGDHGGGKRRAVILGRVYTAKPPGKTMEKPAALP
jgi:hypothetical protein